MRKCYLLTVLSLFLLVPTSIIRAQTISSQKGLTTAVFPTQYGNVKILLPDDIRKGDVITGTVVLEPQGNNARQTERNLAELVKFSVSIDGNKYAVPEKSTPFKWLVAMDRQLNCPIELLHVSGNKAHELTYQLKPTGTENPPHRANCVIPSHALTATPMRITGSFDGDLSNTKCSLNNQPMETLAESPRACIVSFPGNAGGPNRMQVNEKGKELCNKQVSGVQLNVAAGKLNLRKGENTYVDVTITGLQGLQDTCMLTVINGTPGTVNLLPSNNVVIPLIPDSVKSGTYSKRFDIQSTRTGGFVVNVDFSIPEYYEHPFPDDNAEKVCNCTITVSGVKRTIHNPRPTFQALVQKSCTGPAGQCGIGTVTYSWNIAAGKENADIADVSHTKPIVTIQPKNAGKFILQLTATNTCADGTSCTDVKYYNENGDEVGNPADEGRTDEPRQPTEPQKPKDPSSSCACDAVCDIKKTGTDGNEVSYAVDVKAICVGTHGSGSSRSICTAGKPTYKWSIGKSGKDVAEIIGKAEGESVKVKHKKEGSYTLYVNGEVVCSDGTICEFVCSVEQTIPPTPGKRACMPSLSHSVQPLMNGGLKRVYKGIENTKLVRRDDFIALEAEGEDVDLAKPACEILFECPDAGCEKAIPIHGRVKFQWFITGDPKTWGSFVQIGCIPDTLIAEGEHVIFKPPYVPLPVLNNDTTVSTTILLLVIDAGSPVADPTVKKTITIKTTRSKTSADFYSIDITGVDYKPTKSPTPSKAGCSCDPRGPSWIKSDDLKKPDILLPTGSTHNNKLVTGQWMILTTTNQIDKDLATYTCNSASACPTATIPVSYDDIVLWQWTVKGGGTIILSDTGQYVIYEAPKEIPEGKDFIDVTIELKVFNPKGREDPEKSIVTEKVLRIYRPGIRLNYPDITWLPEEKNDVELKSELVYSSAGKWLPAFDHMCRVQYFELIYVSNEKGICMNYPPPDKADVCLDLQLKSGENLEVFAAPLPEKGKCSLSDQFMQARTGKPVKEFTIKAYSLDYGSWGFMRSFANINYGVAKAEKGYVEKGIDKKAPYYQPVAWKTDEILHPLGMNNRAKAKEYKDNRVSIPYDVDENRVADNGWVSAGGNKKDDPLFVINDAAPDAKAIRDAKRTGADIVPKNDSEEMPIGDGFRGDGLGSYEEYRGFKVMLDKKETHIRTDYELKDIFICNENEFELDLYRSVSGLGVHEINKKQFNSVTARLINFNNTARTHVVDQCGLYLFNAGSHDKLLGIAVTNTGSPSTPNFTKEVKIFKDKVLAECDKFNLDKKKKMQAVVAHELLHGNNVCHHGEGNESAEKSHDVEHGLRSGEIECVMHYDNSGNNRDINYIPEPIGSMLCGSRAGTGYNTPENKARQDADGGINSKKFMWFGTALEGRGNCVKQIRVSGRGGQPSNCGNRYDEKRELKKEFKEKEP